MVFISKKQQKQQQKSADRIFKKTGQRVGFAAGTPSLPPPRDISDLGCANCFPRGSFKGNVKGILNPQPTRQFDRRADQDRVNRKLATGRAKKQLTQEELLLLRERGLI